MAIISIISGCYASKPKKDFSINTITTIKKHSFVRAKYSHKIDAKESYLLYFNDKNNILREQILEQEANKILNNNDLRAMESFLLLYPYTKVYKKVFDAYIYLLKKRILKNKKLNDMKKYLILCPKCSDSSYIKEMLASEELKMLGNNPSPNSLQSLIKLYQGTQAAQKAERLLTILTIDYSIMFGGPKAWTSEELKQASFKTQQAVSYLLIISAIRKHKVNELKNIVSTFIKDSKIKKEIESLKGKKAKKIIKSISCILPQETSSSINAMETFLFSSHNGFEKQEILEQLVMKDDPRALLIIIKQIASNDIYTHFIAVQALKARLKMARIWDKFAIKLIKTRLINRLDIPQNIIRLSFLLTIQKQKIPTKLLNKINELPTNFILHKLHFNILNHQKLSIATTLIQESFSSIKQNFPGEIHKNNIPLAMNMLSRLLVLKNFSSLLGNNNLQSISYYIKLKEQELKRIFKAIGIEYFDIRTSFRPIILTGNKKCNPIISLKKYTNLIKLIKKIYNLK